MKNSISISKYIFCIIGLVIIAQAIIIYQEKRASIEKAAVGEGKIEEIYLGITVLGLAGSIFLLTGLSFFRSDYSKQKKIKFLNQYGKSITTKFKGLQLNLHETVNGSHPYFIYSNWLDLETNKTYLFESENIWLDPREFSVPSEIIVLIDPKDPNKYHMDISFLKK